MHLLVWSVVYAVLAAGISDHGPRLPLLEHRDDLLLCGFPCFQQSPPFALLPQGDSKTSWPGRRGMVKSEYRRTVRRMTSRGSDDVLRVLLALGLNSDLAGSSAAVRVSPG